MTPQQREHHKQMLEKFVGVYCQYHCGNAPGELCPECVDLRDYAVQRLDRCPMDPKPKCRDCKVHCFQGSYRDMIRQVMRFSGMHLVKRGRLDLLVRYFVGPRVARRPSGPQADKAATSRTR